MSTPSIAHSSDNRKGLESKPIVTVSSSSMVDNSNTNSDLNSALHPWYYKVKKSSSQKTTTENDHSAIRPETRAQPRSQSQLVVRGSAEYFFKANVRNEFGIGIIKVVWHPRTVVKLFWLFSLLASFSASAYLIISNLMYYYEYEVITKVRNFYESPAQFPQVIVCNQNIITTQYGYNASSRDPNYWANQRGAAPQSDKNLISHSLSDLLLSCYFNGIQCHSSDFYPTYDRNMGNCYAFNAGKNSLGKAASKVLAMRAGSQYGLQLTWYTNYYELLSGQQNQSGGNASDDLKVFQKILLCLP